MFGLIPEIIDCPQCGYPCQRHNYHVSSEEVVICNWCGYDHMKALDAEEFNKGFGSIHYAPKQNNGSNVKPEGKRIVRLRKPLSLIARHNVIMSLINEYDEKESCFCVWNDGTQSLECLFGKKPLTIDEEYEEQRQKAEYEDAMRSMNYCNEDYTEF